MIRQVQREDIVRFVDAVRNTSGATEQPAVLLA